MLKPNSKIKKINFKEIIWTWLGAFLGIGLIGYFNSLFFTRSDSILLIGSFGATAVLLYGNIYSPLAQPRNLFFGSIISAVVGVTISQFLGLELWLAAALAVSSAILFMQLTNTLHPPGGAIALIAVIGAENIQKLGYWYVISPIATGVLIMFIIAMLVNNIPKNRKYPSSWF